MAGCLIHVSACHVRIFPVDERKEKRTIYYFTSDNMYDEFSACLYAFSHAFDFDRSVAAVRQEAISAYAYKAFGGDCYCAYARFVDIASGKSTDSTGG